MTNSLAIQFKLEIFDYISNSNLDNFQNLILRYILISDIINISYNQSCVIIDLNELDSTIKQIKFYRNLNEVYILVLNSNKDDIILKIPFSFFNDIKDMVFEANSKRYYDCDYCYNKLIEIL